MIKRNYLFGLVAAAAAFFISAYGSHAHTTVHGVAPDGVWTWVDGSTLIDQPGVYGTQGVPDAANVPGARRGAASWTDESGRLWLFGGGGFNGAGTSGLLNDLWRFDPDTGLWTWLGGSDGINQPGVYGTEDMPSMGSWPGARSGAASWIDESGNLWLFGGLGFDENGDEGALNDLWRYDPVTGVWTWADGSTIIDQAGVYGTEDVPAAANVPGARAPAGSWFNTDGYLWLFGGSGLDSMGQFGFLNDLWRFDIASDQWTWVDGSTVDDQTGVYGTEDVPAAANVPGARSGAASWPDATGGLWVFGGFGWDSTGAGGGIKDL
ncbi:MAG: hypothetical protein GYB64_08570, partial [Chloroflexi bacterium]|nr:hypothetical protein [Chloroflexota bacterium]